MEEGGRRRYIPRIPVDYSGEGSRQSHVWVEGKSHRKAAREDHEN